MMFDVGPDDCKRAGGSRGLINGAQMGDQIQGIRRAEKICTQKKKQTMGETRANFFFDVSSSWLLLHLGANDDDNVFDLLRSSDADCSHESIYQ